MHPILFKIGPVAVYTYGLFLFLGVLSGYLIVKKRAEEIKISPGIFSNIFAWAIISGFAGARLAYLVVSWGYFLQNPWDLLLGRSGFVFYGGIISGLICLFAAARKYKIRFLKITDTFAVAAPLAHAFGRIGCFFYGCCYGIPTRSFLGIKFPPASPAGMLEQKVIPTQLVSAGFLFLLFIFLFSIRNKVKTTGRLTGYYLLFYSLFRFLIEFVRGDPRGFFLIFSTSQWISLLIIPWAVYILSRKTADAKPLENKGE